MHKIEMKHDKKTKKIKLLKGYGLKELSEKNYEEYNDLLINNDFSKWTMKKTIITSYRFIPKCWIGLRKRGMLIGSCSASFGAVSKTDRMRAAQIEGLAINAEYRRKGFGLFLVNRVLCVLYQNGYENIYVRINSDNIPAIKTYAKAGFYFYSSMGER